MDISYKWPKILSIIAEFDKEFDERYRYENLLGMSIAQIRGHYFNTPLDVIPFGWTGVDGIHFGFLTDFGLAPSLDEAYIVYVNPMDFDAPVDIAARNLADFISICSQGVDPFFIEAIRYTGSKSSYEGYKRERAESIVARKMKLEPYISRLAAHIELTVISDEYDYLQEVKRERHEGIVLETMDGLGVLRSGGETEFGGERMKLPVAKHMKLNPAEIQEFMANANLTSKLALIRDLQYCCILKDDDQVWRMIYDELSRLGMTNEVQAMLNV
ncbi:hypothetical protein ACFFK0_24740 [Paenibacillus chartarius]|uniref:Uncharacterized protein n=1 Tax=Paenibacillus chartarius TaxID=747481 RepID=A0ABV6DSH9_9BACL